MLRLFVFPLTAFLIFTGCATAPLRMELRYSRPADSSWAFVVAEHSGAAQLLLDGRFRDDICRRAGAELRCEIRGLFPGGHTIEVRMAGAVLRRSVVIGRDWPQRPMLVRVRDANQAGDAALSGADAVVYEGDDPDVAHDIVDAAHERGARALVAGPTSLMAQTGADGVYARAIDPAIRRRFPEAREVIAANAQLIVDAVAGPTSERWQAVLSATGVLAVERAADVPFALLGGGGAIVDANNDLALTTILRARKKQKPLHDGTAKLLAWADHHLLVEMQLQQDAVLIAANFDAAPWSFKPDIKWRALDLLGSSLEGDAIVIRPHDIAWITRAPGHDPTHF